DPKAIHAHAVQIIAAHSGPNFDRAAWSWASWRARHADRGLLIDLSSPTGLSSEVLDHSGVSTLDTLRTLSDLERARREEKQRMLRDVLQSWILHRYTDGERVRAVL